MLYLVHALQRLQVPAIAGPAAVDAPRAPQVPSGTGDTLAAEAQHFLRAGAIRRASPRRRVAARLWGHRHDARLRAGANALADPALGARAAQLTSDATRRRLARRIESLAADPRHPHSRMFQARFVAEPELRRLAARLRDEGPVGERGVALARSLFARGVVGPADGEAFRAAVLEALHGLDAPRHGR